jgi:hypothetical protein
MLVWVRFSLGDGLLEGGTQAVGFSAPPLITPGNLLFSPVISVIRETSCETGRFDDARLIRRHNSLR